MLINLLCIALIGFIIWWFLAIINRQRILVLTLVH